MCVCLRVCACFFCLVLGGGIPVLELLTGSIVAALLSQTFQLVVRTRQSAMCTVCSAPWRTAFSSGETPIVRHPNTVAFGSSGSSGRGSDSKVTSEGAEVNGERGDSVEAAFLSISSSSQNLTVNPPMFVAVVEFWWKVLGVCVCVSVCVSVCVCVSVSVCVSVCVCVLV